MDLPKTKWGGQAGLFEGRHAAEEVTKRVQERVKRIVFPVALLW
jgi:hypothetical protein